MHKAIHLVCNAHLDPVWLWRWPEGAAEAISTFRVACEFCESNKGFVFCHNEAVLYEWVEEYEPSLFERIQKLAKTGQWHVMGGWFLQPDCNMPSGESFIRQALYGLNYFQKKLQVRPRVAINFDSFGHSRGLVQILKGCGYEGYLFCRPDQADLKLKDHHFRWVGFDGSEILACRALGHYLTNRGTARAKVENIIKQTHHQSEVVLWGIGNHGGGPSREDLADITQLIKERPDTSIVHSTPEAFFDSIKNTADSLPKVERDLNPWAVGCYTSQIRIKQKHRELENALYRAEKMCTTAASQGLMEYPRIQLTQAMRALLFGEFHDILPGTAIPAAESDSLDQFGFGLELLSQVQTRAFFALSSGQKTAKEGEIPVLVYNPHPFKVRKVIDCEFQLADQNWTGTWTDIKVYSGRKALATQVEKEASNLNLDWRKRVIFEAELQPSTMNRFDCKLLELESKPVPTVSSSKNHLEFSNGRMSVKISKRTGLIDSYHVDGREIVKPNAFCPVVMFDNADPWTMRGDRFNKVIGKFRKATQEQTARWCGSDNSHLDAVRVIEDGDVRTVIESVLQYNNSMIVMQYALPKQGTEFSLNVRVFWAEKDNVLKLAIPVMGEKHEFIGQTAFGVQEFDTAGQESVSQKWQAVKEISNDWVLSCIDDGIYGSDFKNGQLRLTLLKSSAYSGHPINDLPIIPQDRFVPRIDQGERTYTFHFNAGNVDKRLANIDREALVHNEQPVALSFFPHFDPSKPKAEQGITLSGKAVIISAVKLAENNNDMIVRLHNPTSKARKTNVNVKCMGLQFQAKLRAFQVQTYRIDAQSSKVHQTDMIENAL